MPALAATTLLVLSIGASSLETARPYSVVEVIDNASDLSDQRVRVYGLLEHCHYLNCILSGEKTSSNGRKYYLSIGGPEVFDDSVKDHVGKKIVIEATLNLRCFTHPETNAYVLCSDRVSTLAEPKFLGLLQ